MDENFDVRDDYKDGNEGLKDPGRRGLLRLLTAREARTQIDIWSISYEGVFFVRIIPLVSPYRSK